MFEHRLIKFGRAFLLAVCLLFVGGMQQSCRDWLDDYKYDDSEPEWLGESVYAFLKEGTPNHSYRNYVELIDSLGEQLTLETTGSKTLFVADDEAFERFYANNQWGVKSVAEMSKAQRQYLFYNTMLGNAILLDMMPNTSQNSEGDCLRRDTEFNSLDSVPVVHGDYYPLHPSWPTYNKYWEAISEGKDSLLIAMTSSSIIHFFEDYLKKNAISVDDINFIFQKSGKMAKEYHSGDVFLYGNKLVDSEVDAGTFSEDSLTISCKNGYVYRMDEVLLPPMDMASELRVREDTRIFSHLLDRFCVPVYNEALTTDYRVRHNVPNERIYSLRYFTESNPSAGASFAGKDVTAPNGNTKEVLPYDPAGSKGNTDVYAMFVPKDTMLFEYFANPETGAGNFLIKNYAPLVAEKLEQMDGYSDEALEVLLQALDSIPQLNIGTFLNNLMDESFSGTVPSKFDRVTNDAQDEMGINKSHVDECVIANNGVMYILNKVFSPAAFTAVSGPVDVYDNMRIMRKFITDLKYNFYLLAMDAHYSLIVPDDGHFVYYDPITYDKYSKDKTLMKLYSFHYDAKRPNNNSKTDEMWYREFDVVKETMELDTIVPTNKGTAGYVNNIAKDLLEYLIVVHDDVDPGIRPDRLYYSTKGYGTIKIDASDENNIKFYGGEQLETGTEIVSSMIVNRDNGMTYCTMPAKIDNDSIILYSSVPAPPKNSIYKNMLAYGSEEDDLYYEFFKLCSPANDMLNVTLKKILAVDEVPKDTAKLYSVFYTDTEMINCVPFLNTYHYTVYVPSNEAMQELYAQGLPKWEVIGQEGGKNPQRAMSLIRFVNNFARYHFQDQSVYHDRSPFFIPDVKGGKKEEASFATSLVNATTGRFYELKVKSDANNRTILVEDDWAKAYANMSSDAKNSWVVNNTNRAEILNTEGLENKTWNVMCRDRQGSKEIVTSSFAVIQPINRALLNSNFFGYDGRFARFAVNGCRVDTMRVYGGANGVMNNDMYLVADAGRVPRSTTTQPQPADLENLEIAYLMQPIDATDENYEPSISREVLVLDADEQPILITRDGYRVVKTMNDRLKTVSYNYYTEKGADGKDYRVKLANTGETIERKEVEVGSNEGTSDEE